MKKVMSIVGTVLMVVCSFIWLAPIMAPEEMTAEAALGWLFLTPILGLFAFAGLILLVVGLLTGTERGSRGESEQVRLLVKSSHGKAVKAGIAELTKR